MRIVDTGIKTTNKTREIFNAVIGQMSDGIWENTPSMTGYWANCDVDATGDTIKLNIREAYSTKYHNCMNLWVKMNDTQVLKFFANRIKQIALIEMEDEYDEKLREDILGEDLCGCAIPMNRYEEYKEKYKEYEAYKSAHPFVKAGKFVESNERELLYLNYEENITVKDAVITRRELLENMKKIAC